MFHEQILWRALSINEALSLIVLQGGKLWYRSSSEGASWKPYPALTCACKVSVCLRSERHISLIMRTSWRYTPPDWPSPAQTDSPTSLPSNPFLQTLETPLSSFTAEFRPPVNAFSRCLLSNPSINQRYSKPFQCTHPKTEVHGANINTHTNQCTRTHTHAHTPSWARRLSALQSFLQSLLADSAHRVLPLTQLFSTLLPLRRPALLHPARPATFPYYTSSTLIQEK